MNKFKIYFLFLATTAALPFNINSMASRLLLKRPISNNFLKFYSTKINKSNAYKAFGISESLNISKQDLDKLYYDLVKHYHPDKNLKFNSQAHNKFLEIKEAYEYIKKNHQNFKHANQFKEEDLKLLQKLILEEYLKWREAIDFEEYKKKAGDKATTNQTYESNSRRNIQRATIPLYNFTNFIKSQQFKDFIKSPFFKMCFRLVIGTLVLTNIPDNLLQLLFIDTMISALIILVGCGLLDYPVTRQNLVLSIITATLVLALIVDPKEIKFELEIAFASLKNKVKC